MRYALVDQSTFSAVERIIGRAPVENKYVLDGDISAMENLVNAILFYDCVIATDDYIEKHKEDRKRLFPFVMFLGREQINFGSTHEFTQNIANGLRIRIKGSMIDDGELIRFIDLLRMNMVFTWRMRSSIFWLTANLLAEPDTKEIHRYSKLWETISSELVHQKIQDSEIDQPGFASWNLENDVKDLVPSTGYAISQQVQDFLAALGWLTYRTAFYTSLAFDLGCDALLHPIRSSFQIEFLSKYFGLHQNVYSTIVQAMNDNLRDTIVSIKQSLDPVVTSWRVPLLSVYILSRTNDPRRIIEEAVNLRNKAPFITLRRLLLELEDLKAESEVRFVIAVNKCIRAVDHEMQSIRRLYGVSQSERMPVAPIISAANLLLEAKAGISLPTVDLTMPTFGFFDRLHRKRKLSIYCRSITADLVAVSQLGYMRDKLLSASSVTGARYHKQPIEDEMYYGPNSSVREWA